jgi:hypothetical protein
MFILRFSPTGSLGFWLGVHYKQGGGEVFLFCRFPQVVGFEDVGLRGFFGRPKGQIRVNFKG